MPDPQFYTTPATDFGPLFVDIGGGEFGLAFDPDCCCTPDDPLFACYDVNSNRTAQIKFAPVLSIDIAGAGGNFDGGSFFDCSGQPLTPGNECERNVPPFDPLPTHFIQGSVPNILALQNGTWEMIDVEHDCNATPENPIFEALCRGIPPYPFAWISCPNFGSSGGNAPRYRIIWEIQLDSMAPLGNGRDIRARWKLIFDFSTGTDAFITYTRYFSGSDLPCLNDANPPVNADEWEFDARGAHVTAPGVYSPDGTFTPFDWYQSSGAPPSPCPATGPTDVVLTNGH